MARVQAGADQAVMVLDGGQDHLGRVPAVQRFAGGAVRMDRDADVVLGHQFVKTVEAVRIGVGTQVANAQVAGKLEDPAIGRVVLVNRSTPNEIGVMLSLVHRLRTALICTSVASTGKWPRYSSM